MKINCGLLTQMGLRSRRCEKNSNEEIVDMYTQKDKSKENGFTTNGQESRAVANAIGQKKSKSEDGFGVVDNRSNTIPQIKISNSANQFVDSKNRVSQGKFVNQMKVAAGFVPANPAMFRAGGTTINGTAGQIYDGESGFTDKDKVIANNETSGSLTYKTTTGKRNTSDVSQNGLFGPQDARVVAPEVDHIVPKADGGSNDYSNARVVSKGENTNQGTGRPSNAQRLIAVYQDLNVSIGSQSKWISKGTGFTVNNYERLNIDKLNPLLTFQGGNDGHTDYSSVKKTELNQIRTIPTNQTKNDITIK